MNASDNSDRFSPENLLYDGAAAIVSAEMQHLREWRGREPQVGLALSGGGIRSATYCLGVMQALAYRRALPQVDYLSTVSGGGYIGASLTYLLHQSAQGAAMDGLDAPLKFDVSRENFPYVSYPMVGVANPVAGPQDTQLRQNENFKGRLLRRLRQSANYLVPGDGITMLSLVGVVLRNLVNSLLVHVALLVLLFEVFFLNGWLAFTSHSEAGMALNFQAPNVFLAWAGMLIVAYGLLSMLYIVCTRAFDALERHGHSSSYGVRRLYEATVHYLFVAALVLLVVGGLPWVYELLAGTRHTGIPDWLQALGNTDKGSPSATGVAATLIGVIGNVWGLLQARSGNKHRIPTGLLVGLASALLAFGLLLLVYMLTGWLHANASTGGDRAILMTAGAVLLLLGWLPEANYVSLHRYYRDRLMELFLPDPQRIRDLMLANVRRVECFAGLQPGDATLVGDLCRASAEGDNKLLRGPYPLINANVVLTASHHPRYRPRGGDNYIFSPLFCGSRATGWNLTDRTPGSGFTLATAMAISGAAVNPDAGPDGQGVTRQPVLSVLMGLLNLRLGYWAPNRAQTTAKIGSSQAMHWVKPNLLYPGLFETLGRFNLNEHARYSLLTDGGHFENLGLYELVRRRLKLIIVCDAGADPDFKFTDLANAIQKVRADFGAIIDIDAEQLATLVPQPQGAVEKQAGATAQRGYLMAPIRYSVPIDQAPELGREVGTLILLKATAFKGEPADVFSYRREHPEFPDQSTLDQFFDEKQFDSYRELGYITADQMLKEIEASRLVPGDEYQTAKGYMAPSKHQVARLLFGLPPG